MSDAANTSFDRIGSVPILSSSKVIRVLEQAGYVEARQHGSHQTFKLTNGDRVRVVVVPLRKKQIPRGTVRAILSQAGLAIPKVRNGS